MRNRRSKERRKSSASSVDRRRPGPGKVMSLHGGVVEAVSAAQLESVRAFREKAREKSVPVSGWVATGASEARSSVVRGPKRIPHMGKTWGKVEEHAPTAMRDPPKRSERRETLCSPVSTGGNPLSARSANADDDGPAKRQGTGARYRVLGSRNGSDASLISLLRKVARSPSRVGPSPERIDAPSAETPRLTRNGGDSRTKGCAGCARNPPPD